MGIKRKQNKQCSKDQMVQMAATTLQSAAAAAAAEWKPESEKMDNVPPNAPTRMSNRVKALLLLPETSFPQQICW